MNPENPSAKTEPIEKDMTYYWRRHIRPILLLILVFTAARSSLVDWNDVPTGSMEPTIFVGDRIFVNKLAYGFKVPYTTWHIAKWSGPQRGEIVVFYSPVDGVRLVKRVIGLPGDRIEIKGGFLTINGTPLKYADASPELSDIPTNQQRKFHFYTEEIEGHPHLMALANAGSRLPSRDGTFEVSEGHYFMMGDNRDNSNDSRFIGVVPREQILGRANRVVFSLDYDDNYLPRKNRYFHALP